MYTFHMGKPILDADEIARRYNSGESEKALSLSFGVDRRVIRRHLISSGVKPRNRSEAMYVRMAKLGPEERLALAAAAHEKVRGIPLSIENRLKIAEGNQRTMPNTSAYEDALARGLDSMGVTYTRQLACGPYNIDIAAGDLAIEVLGGGWHRSKSHGERINHLLESGFNVLYIWSRKEYPVTPETATHVAKFLASPQLEPHYWVMRGNGKRVAQFRHGIDPIPDIVPFTDRPSVEPASVPEGYCRCGCGGATRKLTHARGNYRAGDFRHYINGHNKTSR